MARAVAQYLHVHLPRLCLTRPLLNHRAIHNVQESSTVPGGATAEAPARAPESEKISEQAVTTPAYVQQAPLLVLSRYSAVQQ